MSRKNLTPGTAIDSQAKGHPVTGTEEAGRAFPGQQSRQRFERGAFQPDRLSPLSHENRVKSNIRLLIGTRFWSRIPALEAGFRPVWKSAVGKMVLSGFLTPHLDNRIRTLVGEDTNG